MSVELLWLNIVHTVLLATRPACKNIRPIRVVRLMPEPGSGLLSFLFCEGEPVCQKHRNFADPNSKNERGGNEAVPTVAATAHLPRITEAALNKVEG